MSEIALADLLEHLEGIGAQEIRALAGVGVYSVEDLDGCCTAGARFAELSRRTGIADARLRRWLGRPLLETAGPATGAPDARVVLRGANLGDAPDDGRLVLFQGRPAAIEDWSPSRIVVRMPGVRGRGMLFAVIAGEATNAIEWEACGPSLVAGDLSAERPRPLAGEPVRLRAELHNRGTAPTGPFEVVWEVGDRRVALPHGSLEPGQRSEESSLGHETVLPAGAHVVRFAAAGATAELELRVAAPRDLVLGVSDPLCPLDPRAAGPAGAGALVFAPLRDLAARWEPECGSDRLRVTLGEGLRFHDGEPVTARAVVAACAGAARELDERTVLVDSEAVLATPIHARGAGAGPFAVAERVPGERLVLRAHAHHRPAPRLDRIVVLALAPAEILARLEAGELDAARLPYDSEVERGLTADGRWTVVRLPSAGLDVQSRAVRERDARAGAECRNAHLWYVRD
jgi:peptide/nickel transport system substrate-binding protein